MASKEILMFRNEFEWGVCWCSGNVILFPPEYKVSDKDGEHPVGSWRVQTTKGLHSNNEDFEHYCDALDYLNRCSPVPVRFETKEERIARM